MPAPFYWVDAFADGPFQGNAAGVCFMEGPASDEWMRRLTAEMSLSEIAYLWPDEGVESPSLVTGFVRDEGGVGEGDPVWRLRWFTPAAEVDLCGHATLASAHVMFSTGRADAGHEIRFRTLSGTHSASLGSEGPVLDFPQQPMSPVDAAREVFEAIGVEPLYTGQGPRDLLAELPSASLVRDLKPNFEKIAALSGECLTVTARSDDPRYDFVSRYFAPKFGIPEDPATGSAHCQLAPYWSAKLGKTKLTAYQASKRGAVLHMDVETSPGRTLLSGKAVTLFEGMLTVEPQRS